MPETPDEKLAANGPVVFEESLTPVPPKNFAITIDKILPDLVVSSSDNPDVIAALLKGRT